MNDENTPNNKDNKKDISSWNNQDFSVWSKIGIQFKDSDLISILKKCERISTGIYMVSSYVDSKEPLKWQLRDLSLDFSLKAFGLNSQDPNYKAEGLLDFVNISTKIISLLSISSMSGILLHSNVRILKNEIEKVSASIVNYIEKDFKSAGYVLSDAFFQEIHEKDNKGHIKDIGIGKAIYKDNTTSNSQNNLHINSSGNSVGGNSKPSNPLHASPIKNSREDLILNILKKGGSLSIKDFSQVIKNCSEKTIQRELINMLGKGLIKKEGERRWSRYYI